MRARLRRKHDQVGIPECGLEAFKEEVQIGQRSGSMANRLSSTRRVGGSISSRRIRPLARQHEYQEAHNSMRNRIERGNLVFHLPSDSTKFVPAKKTSTQISVLIERQHGHRLEALDEGGVGARPLMARAIVSLRGPIFRNAAMFVAVLFIAVVGLFVHYSSEFRGLTFWHRTQIATVIRLGNPIGTRMGVHRPQRQSHGLCRSTEGNLHAEARLRSPLLCGRQSARVGREAGTFSRQFTKARRRFVAFRWTAGRCHDTTWVSGQTSIDFHSAPTSRCR